MSKTLFCSLIVFSLVVSSAGCDASSSSEPAEEASTEGAAAGECAGATEAEASREYHPRILRGRVLAPFGELASRSVFPDWLVAAAHAAPLEEEQTVANATVELYQVGPGGEQKGEVLRQTTTDVRGEWCMKLPEGVEFGADLMLEARADEVRLRRSVASELATDIYSTSEALTRLLEQQNVDFTKIPTQTYLNMESIAASTVGLLDPVALEEGDGVEDAIVKIVDALQRDERLLAKLANLPTLK